MSFQPLFNIVLVKRRDPLTQTPGGLYIPQNAEKAPSEGAVVAVGNGAPLDNGNVRPVAVQPGDHVYFRGHGHEITVDGEALLLLREEDILGILK